MRLHALAAAVLIAGTCSLPLRAEESVEAIREGDAAREAGRLGDAVAAYTRALEADAACVAAWHGRALARRRLGEFPAALADLTRALDLAPGTAALHHDLGLTRLDAGDLKGAVAAYDEAILLAPDASRTWNNRAFAKRRMGDADGALADITMAIQLDPGYARAYRHRALCLFNLGEWEDALGDFETAVRLEPDDQDRAHLRMWMLRARLGRREEADRRLREWVKNAKDLDAFTRSTAGYLLGEQTREELLAAAGTGNGREEQVRRTEAHFVAAERALADGDPAAARKDLEAALESGVEGTEVMRSVEAELEREEQRREREGKQGQGAEKSRR